MAVELRASVDHLDGFIGPGCSIVCQPVGLLAAAWGIPLLSFGCTSSAFTDTKTYPTFGRTTSTYSSRALAYAHLATMFGWSRIGILTTFEDNYRQLAISVVEELEKHNKTVFSQTIEKTVRGQTIDEVSMQALRESMTGMRKIVHIFYLMGNAADMRNMLITAFDLDMLNGEFVFVTDGFTIETNVERLYRPELDPILYDGLVAIGFKSPSGPGWDRFRRHVIAAFQDPRFDHLSHLPADASIEEVTVFAGV